MDDDDEIKARAHAIWEKEGRPHGRHHEHWDEARRQVEAERGQRASAVEPPGDVADQTAPVKGSLVGKVSRGARASDKSTTKAAKAPAKISAKSSAPRDAVATSREAKNASAAKSSGGAIKSKRQPT
jgi:hypothetical protein